MRQSPRLPDSEDCGEKNVFLGESGFQLQRRESEDASMTWGSSDMCRQSKAVGYEVRAWARVLVLLAMVQGTGPGFEH